MPAEKIGIIAGEGEIPEILYNYCKERNHKVKVAALKNYAKIKGTDNQDVKYFRIGQVGGILKWLKNNDIRNVVLIGKVTRPNLFSIFPDFKGWSLLFKILKVYNSSDTPLFDEITNFIENEGLKLVGIHQIIPEILAKKGFIGGTKPNKDQIEFIKSGFIKAKDISKKDKGQAIVYGENPNGQSKILAKEDMRGTNEMIKDFIKGSKRYKGEKYLLKVKKPHQDERIDLPTIGLETIELCSEARIKGIILEASASLIVNSSECVKLAKERNIFIYGV